MKRLFFCINFEELKDIEYENSMFNSAVGFSIQLLETINNSDIQITFHSFNKDILAVVKTVADSKIEFITDEEVIPLLNKIDIFIVNDKNIAQTSEQYLTILYHPCYQNHEEKNLHIVNSLFDLNRVLNAA
ncbi:hypothetical protein [Candidatus Marinarcus aquaticus]|uniref:Uncharacterized protein n=1 Tax=Candidatus Marinarcus aquaticus TaxID=2044504 RepID=A0A4Q0XNJ6_9BACT|nr:hypothetical protein [Candidatus Marinarcus aquaticus]RXJ55381.1 hypothetical protein CRV04_09760 [Candidatus Marinarcus aquaticus]